MKWEYSESQKESICSACGYVSYTSSDDRNHDCIKYLKQEISFLKKEYEHVWNLYIQKLEEKA